MTKYKHRRFNGLLILTLVLMLCSCSHDTTSESEDANASEFRHMDRVVNDQYTKTEINFKDIGIKKASGLLYHENLLYISDLSAQTVNVYDQNYTLLTNISDDRLTSPSLITANNTSLYVLDKSTSQIFEFNINNTMSYEVTRVFSLPVMDQETSCIDLEIFNDKLYLTFETTLLKDAVIMSLNLKNEACTFAEGDYEDFYGYVSASDDGTLRFIQTLQYYENYGEIGFGNKKSNVFTLNEDQIKFQNELLYGSCPTDFYSENNMHYIYVAGWSSIDRYDSDFKYIDSISVFKLSDINVILKGSSDKLSFLMLNEQKLWEINKK